MGANLIIVAATAIVLQSPHQDSTAPSVAHGIAFERLPDILQYNRVQGLSFGLGYRVGVSGTHFTGMFATVRYGLSDERITGRISLLRDASSRRVILSGYSDIADLDPYSAGRTFGNTFNGIFAGHDNGDYAFARGGSAGVSSRIRPGLELTVTAKVERQSSVTRVAESELNDFLGGTGLFPPNPPIDEGTFGGGSVTLTRTGGNRWSLTADVLAGAGQATGRLFGDARRHIGSGLGITLRAKAGAATEPAIVQNLFRLGGLNTVRGFEYGTLRGAAFWAAQLDVSPFHGRVRPVVFMDAGQASRISNLFSTSALVGGGVGVSFFRGLVRFDLSRPISPDDGSKLRFDLVIQGVR